VKLRPWLFLISVWLALSFWAGVRVSDTWQSRILRSSGGGCSGGGASLIQGAGESTTGWSRQSTGSDDEEGSSRGDSSLDMGDGPVSIPVPVAKAQRPIDASQFQLQLTVPPFEFLGVDAEAEIGVLAGKTQEPSVYVAAYKGETELSCGLASGGDQQSFSLNLSGADIDEDIAFVTCTNNACPCTEASPPVTVQVDAKLSEIDTEGVVARVTNTNLLQGSVTFTTDDRFVFNARNGNENLLMEVPIQGGDAQVLAKTNEILVGLRAGQHEDVFGQEHLSRKICRLDAEGETLCEERTVSSLVRYYDVSNENGWLAFNVPAQVQANGNVGSQPKQASFFPPIPGAAEASLSAASSQDLVIAHFGETVREIQVNLGRIVIVAVSWVDEDKLLVAGYNGAAFPLYLISNIRVAMNEFDASYLAAEQLVRSLPENPKSMIVDPTDNSRLFYLCNSSRSLCRYDLSALNQQIVYNENRSIFSLRRSAEGNYLSLDSLLEVDSEDRRVTLVYSIDSQEISKVSLDTMSPTPSLQDNHLMGVFYHDEDGNRQIGVMNLNNIEGAIP
jgi:hypothetical protein